MLIIAYAQIEKCIRMFLAALFVMLKKKPGNKVNIFYMENVLQLYNGILNTEKINSWSTHRQHR